MSVHYLVKCLCSIKLPCSKSNWSKLDWVQCLFIPRRVMLAVLGAHLGHTSSAAAARRTSLSRRWIAVAATQDTSTNMTSSASPCLCCVLSMSPSLLRHLQLIGLICDILLFSVVVVFHWLVAAGIIFETVHLKYFLIIKSRCRST